MPAEKTLALPDPLKLIPTTTSFNLERCTVQPLLPSNHQLIPEISLSKFP
ncbi:hypothetical protein OIU77_021405 [Salix suchowensis]|uniref:Uncharacterized protein n=1 Tax=Salix suchowensis TaxID=1278906 RepID=A0ABQ9C9U2_9ROSI|nr:hypothetical protein OIU77_021405 [Salix suchowensis]